MEKENRLKLRISRMFRSSFASCRPRSSSDVVDSAVLSSKSHPLLRPASAPADRRPLPSLCPDPSISINPTCIVSAKKAVSVLPRRSWAFPYGSSEVEHYHRYSSLATVSRRYCPSSSPFYKTTASKQSKTRKKDKKKKKKSSEKDKLAGRRPFLASTSSQETNTTYGRCDWFSSDDERQEENEDSDGHWGDESDTLFSPSDESSASLSRRRLRQRRRSLRKPTGSFRKTSFDDVPEENAGGGDIDIKGSFAVVKRSSDPYGDFRTSMVEMIIERQLFGDEELRRLLRCFLALNSSRHHGVIVEVFTGIRETLFSSSAGRWS